MKSDDTTDLAARGRIGDASAVEELIHKVDLCVYRSLIAKGCSDPTLLTRDIQFLMFRGIQGLRVPDRFWGWLWTIVDRRFQGYLREKRQDAACLAGVEAQSPSIDQYPADQIGPSDELHRKALKEYLSAAMTSLDEEMRTIVVLHFFEGFTHRQIADKMRISHGQVRTRLYQAIQQLRRFLIDHGYSSTF